MSSSTWHRHVRMITLFSATCGAFAFGGTPLRPVGCFQLLVSTNDGTASLRRTNTAPQMSDPAALPILSSEQSSHESQAGMVGDAEGTVLSASPLLPWPVPTAAALRKDGVILDPHALSSSQAAKLRAHCEAQLSAAMSEVSAGDVDESEFFGSVLARQQRFDMKLALDPLVAEALGEALDGCLAPTIRDVLGSRDPFLAELGVIRSMNGAPRQPLHADTPRSDAPVLLTAFLALQDIDEDMGPTTFLPGTHADAEAHAALSSPTEKAKLLSQGRRLGNMPEGACALYDSRLLHAGGANNSPRPRWLMYAGFCSSRLVARELRGERYADLQRGIPTLGDLLSA